MHNLSNIYSGIYVYVNQSVNTFTDMHEMYNIYTQSAQKRSYIGTCAVLVFDALTSRIIVI